MIAIRGLTKTFETPAGRFPALRGIDAEIHDGEYVAVLGRSGSGKSTLLHMLAGIDRPTSGSVTVDGAELAGMNHDRLARWRGGAVGIVFQFFQLLPTLTALENVLLPMDFRGALPSGQRRTRARELLARVGVADQANKLPATLSGGQQQRVAIARALANDPPLLLADEPTGNLDSETGAAIFQLFGELAGAGRTIVVVTHERDIVRGPVRALTLADGRIES